MKKCTKFLLITSFVLSGAAISTGFDVSGNKVEAAEIAETESVKAQLGFNYSYTVCEDYVFFTRGREEYGTPNLYAFKYNAETETTDENAPWPGVASEYVYTNNFNQRVYRAKLDSTRFDTYIWNGDNVQTEDIKVSTEYNAYWVSWDTGNSSQIEGRWNEDNEYYKREYSFSNVRLRFQAVIPSSYFDGKEGYSYGINITMEGATKTMNIDCTEKGLGEYDASNKYFMGTVTNIPSNHFNTKLKVKAYVQVGETVEYTPERTFTVKEVAGLYATYGAESGTISNADRGHVDYFSKKTGNI